jgi:hypothetical protein
VSSGAFTYKPSIFQIISTSGHDIGTPVSYGDIMVLVDEKERVWNNKIGVGPTTLNGYFGPRDRNAAGEMYLSFFQLDEEYESDSSDDDDDNFLSLSNLAKTTKSMAENHFVTNSEVELNVTAALRTMGKVVYYGDRNIIIDVADSNRVRSKFNRVITHYRRKEGPNVQEGYLRCDGQGKTILFELHGLPVPSIKSINVSDGEFAMAETGDDHSGLKFKQKKKVSIKLSWAGPISFGQPIRISNTHRKRKLESASTDLMPTFFHLFYVEYHHPIAFYMHGS